MRLVIVLGATGAAALTAWAAAAQDWTDDAGHASGTPAAGRNIHYFSRNGSTSRQAAPSRPVPVPGVRNYYDQLFAEPQPAALNPSGVRTAGGTEADSAGLLHADHVRQAGRHVAGNIRQTGAAKTSSAGKPGPRVRPPVTSSVRPVSAEQDSRSAGPVLPAGVTDEKPNNVSTDENPFAAMVRQNESAAPAQSAEPPLNTSETPTAPVFTAPSFEPPVKEELSARETSNETVAPPTVTPPERAVEYPSHRTDTASGQRAAVAIGDSGGPAAVEVRWERISEITVGRECDCELVVKNGGSGAAREVAVEAFFPKSVRLTSAEPKPVAAEDHLTWSYSTLPAGAERRIRVTLVPSEQGDLKISAFVRYTEAAAATLAVREPQLQVALSGPSDVAVGEAASQTITVSNPGSGTADDVMVEVQLPSGLEHGKGRKLSMPVGSLSPGQSQIIRLPLIATHGGPQEVRVRATSGTTLRHDAACTISVNAPSLKVGVEGPSLRFVGRNAEYRIRVTNGGGAAANNVRVMQTVPEGFTFVRADNGGRLESGPSQVVWYVGHLEAGQTADLTAELTASRLGSYKHLVSVLGEGGVKADAVVQTAVDGVASLVVEVLDLDDPVEVGSETAYEIRVRNEGTKAAKNVEVSCQVPAGVAALSARGPTEHRPGELNTTSFAPVGSLEPGKTALYQIKVRGTAPGKHRFRVRLTSDSIDEPLIHEELTHYYAD